MHDGGIMNKELWTGVESYIDKKLVRQDKALEQALADSKAAGLPGIQVTPNLGKLLMLMARMIGAKRILEIGTLGGYSTIWLARGMGDLVEIMLGAALETLPKVAGRGPFDLIFIDADKENTPGYWEWAMKLARPGTVIIVDNVVRDGKVIDAQSKDASVQGIREGLEMMSKEKRVSATAMQMVGAKGYDGFA